MTGDGVNYSVTKSSDMKMRFALAFTLALFVGVGVAAVPAAAQVADGSFGDGIGIGDGDDVPGEFSLVTDNGTTLVVDGVVTGGHASVVCTDDSAESYCDKDGELFLGPGTLEYDGYNEFDGEERAGGFGDTFAVTLDGESVATVDVTMQDGPIATLVGLLGGLGFGLFG